MTDLVIEAEFPLGVAFAASPQRRGVVEWPPHPDRLFRALAATLSRRLDIPRQRQRREEGAHDRNNH